MIDDGDPDEGGGMPFARSYDFFKHMTGVALVTLGGVFAFLDGGLKFNRSTLLVLLFFLLTAAATSFIAASGLAGLEVKPEPRETTARKIRIAQMIVAGSLSAGLGGFVFNFTAALFR